MHKKPPAQSLNKLAHPIFVFALGLILLNAMILQPHLPSWLTGKLADLAWMVVLPVASAALLGSFWRGSVKLTFWLPTVLIGLSFALMKTLPEVNALVHGLFFDLFHVPLKLTLDPSDLIALSGIPLGAWIWGHNVQNIRRIWCFAPLILMVMAGIADAVDPGYDQIDCLVVDGENLIAFTPERSLAYIGNASERKAYLSHDNGRTWEDIGNFSPHEEEDDGMVEGIEVVALISECQTWNQQAWVGDPLNPRVLYMIVSDQGVYRSWDGGETLIREFEISEGVEFKDVVFAPDGRTLVIAASTHGVLLRLQSGSYIWADPSGMSRVPRD